MQISTLAANVGGEGGIRTHGTLARTPVFETGLFNLSSTSPNGRVCYQVMQYEATGEFTALQLRRPQFSIEAAWPRQGFLAQFQVRTDPNFRFGRPLRKCWSRTREGSHQDPKRAERHHMAR